MAQKLHIRRQAHDVSVGQRRIQPRQRLLAGIAAHNQLGNHGVVIGADGIALAHAVIDTHGIDAKRTRSRFAIDLQAPRGGQEVVVGIFSTNTCLYRMTCERELLLFQGQRLARCHAQLPLHQVQTGDGFSNRMLHLQTGVHLHKVKTCPHACP